MTLADFIPAIDGRAQTEQLTPSQLNAQWKQQNQDIVGPANKTDTALAPTSCRPIALYYCRVAGKLLGHAVVHAVHTTRLHLHNSAKIKRIATHPHPRNPLFSSP